MDPQSQNKNRPRKRRPTLDLQQMIAESDVTELRSFLRLESKKNKALALKLKTKLLLRYNPPTDENKYRLLLGELIAEGTDGTVALSKREIRLFNEICKHLLEMSRHYHIRNEHRENHRLLSALILYLHRYVDKQETAPEMLEDRLAETYTALLSLLQYEIAPELRDDVITAGLEAMTRSYHILHHPTLNMPAVLLSATNDRDQLKSTTSFILEKVQRDSQQILWAFWYAIYCSNLSLSIDIDELSREMTVKDIYNAAQLLQEYGFSDAFNLWLLSFGTLDHLDRTRKLQWAAWQLGRSTEFADDTGRKEYGYELLRSTGDQRYWDVLLDVMRPDEIVNQLIRDRRLDLALDYLSVEGRFDDLAHLIDSHQDWDLFLIHLPNIIKRTENPFATIWNLVKPFADAHAGKMCLDGLEEVISVLESKGASELIELLQEALAETFPGRFDDLLKGLKFSY